MNAAPAAAPTEHIEGQVPKLTPNIRYAFTRDVELQVSKDREARWPTKRGSIETVYKLWGGDNDEFYVVDADGTLPSVLTVEKRVGNFQNAPTAERISGENVRFRARDSIRDKLRVITDALGVTTELRQKAFGILREAKLKASQVAFQLARPQTVLFGRGGRDRSPSASTFTVTERMDHERVVGNEVQKTQTVTLKAAGGASQKIIAQSGALDGYALDERQTRSSLADMSVVRAAQVLSQSSPAVVCAIVSRSEDSDTTLCELVRVAVQKVKDAPEPPPPPPTRHESRRDR